MEKKEDRRTAMTRRMLKEALTEMLREMDIYHISIRELCQRADVNRTTFYKYYGSQFDLLGDMEKDILDLLSKAIKEHAANPVMIIKTVCEYLEEHLEFGRLIINNNVDPLFPQKLFGGKLFFACVLLVTAQGSRRRQLHNGVRLHRVPLHHFQAAVAKNLTAVSLFAALHTAHPSWWELPDPAD